MDPVSGAGSATRAAFQIAVASKALDLTKEQGKEAVSLIESADVKPAQQGSLGRLVNVRA
jgi:hypothetical protein